MTIGELCYLVVGPDLDLGNKISPSSVLGVPFATTFPLPPRIVVAPVDCSPRPDVPPSYHRAALLLRFWFLSEREEDNTS